MSEEKKLIGKLAGVEKGASGTKKDGTAYQVWKYQLEVGDKLVICSGFIEANDMIGKNVEVTYTLKPNMKNADNPFKNVSQIVEAGVVEAAEKKYNMAEVGAKPMINVFEEKDKNILFQVCFKGAIELTKVEITKMEGPFDMTKELTRSLEIAKLLYIAYNKKKAELKDIGDW